MMKQFSEVNHVNGLKSPVQLSSDPYPTNTSPTKTEAEVDGEPDCREQKDDIKSIHTENSGVEVESPAQSDKLETKSDSSSVDSGSSSEKTINGGTLTFFQEGKPLLELFHKHEKSNWYQVKSKTYWPPSTTAKTTTVCQEQFRSDHMIMHPCSDGFSSSNSSPWSQDHCRKQVVPQKYSKVDDCFMYASTKLCKRFLKRKRLKRFSCRPYNCKTDLREKKFYKRELGAKKITGIVKVLYDRVGVSFDSNISINSILENFNKEVDSMNHSIFSPRKRYLRHWDHDSEAFSRKKSHAISHIPQKDMQSSSPSFVPASSAINSLTSSYSIDSLLSNESSAPDDSFLRNILKPDKQSRKASSTKPSKSIAGKTDRQSFPYRKESPNERQKLSDKSDIGAYFNSATGLSSLYLNSYLNPRVWGHPSTLPASSHANEAASLAAVAAAVNSRINHPIVNTSPLIPTPHPLLSMTPYLPSSSINHFLSANSNLTSFNHPLSPVQNCVPPTLSPRMSSNESPRPPSWASSSPGPNRNSPYKDSPLVSPPPQDVPLNLSKPKEKG